MGNGKKVAFLTEEDEAEIQLGSRDRRKLGKGHEDNFEPVVALDLSQIQNFDDLTKAMANTAFGGRTVGEAVDALYQMATDPDCFVVLTLSGAMTVAKMGLVISDMIDKGLVHAVVSTGALMTHGFVEAAGMHHYKYRFGQMNDEELFEKGYNRVYDTLEPERNLDAAEIIVKKVLDTLDLSQPIGSIHIHNSIGKYLNEHLEGRGVLKSAYEKGVPVYVPAFTDSELGLDVGIFNRRKKKEGSEDKIQYDAYIDLEHYTELVRKQKTLGIFTIGGGVPRNWAQQVGPYLDIIQKRLRAGGAFVRFKYGVRICPEPVHWGGLSGCTYSEGVSWGKFMSVKEGGVQVEVLSDATIAWPLIIKATLERLEKNNIEIKKNFSLNHI